MLQFLFFGTRICLLNFHTMWVLPVLALAALLVFRLLWGGRQPCKGLMWVLPAAYVLAGVGNAFLLAADNTALVSLKFKNGAIGVIDNCRKASYGYDQRLEVFGSKAQASAANDTPTHVAFIDENGKVTDKPLYFFLERYMQSFTDEMTEFIDCVLHDKPTKTTVEDGLQALRMGLAAKKSLAEHRPVKLSEIEA